MQVGIGVVVLRRANGSGEAEVLLVRRAKPPEVGKWTFPGGSLELGEVDGLCACLTRKPRSMVQSDGKHSTKRKPYGAASSR